MRVLSGKQSSIQTDPDFQQNLLTLIPFLRAFARSLCRNRELAEDLAQEALAKAWRARRGFEAGSNLKAWLFTILRNEYYSHGRRAWRQAHWDQDKSDTIAAPPDLQLLYLELSDTANALRELPDNQREALILVAAGGFSYEDAAKICGTPIGTIKSRAARGRLALIEILNGGEKIARSKSVSHLGGSKDILAQLAAFTPARTHRDAERRRPSRESA